MNWPSSVHQALNSAVESLVEVIVDQLGLLFDGSDNNLLILEDGHLLRSMMCYA